MHINLLIGSAVSRARASMSAVAYFFAKKIVTEVGVPIGWITRFHIQVKSGIVVNSFSNDAIMTTTKDDQSSILIESGDIIQVTL